jgi:hypothetical protein
VGGRGGAVAEASGRFEDDVDPELVPGQGLGVRFGQEPQERAVDLDALVAHLDVAGEPAVDRVALQQLGHLLGGCEVVGGDDLDGRALLTHGAHEAAADPTEAVDAHADRHGRSPPVGRWVAPLTRHRRLGAACPPRPSASSTRDLRPWPGA